MHVQKNTHFGTMYFITSLHATNKNTVKRNQEQVGLDCFLSIIFFGMTLSSVYKHKCIYLWPFIKKLGPLLENHL